MLAFQDFTSPSSCSYFTYDIPAPALITAPRSSHERNLSVPYARYDHDRLSTVVTVNDAHV